MQTNGFQSSLIRAFLPVSTEFDRLAQSLALLGWTQEPDRASMNADEQEPVFVSWSRADSDGEIDYTFEPETGLKYLEIRGYDRARYAGEMRRRLPVLAVSDVERMLESSDRKEVRLALRIASLMRDGSLAEKVIEHLNNPDPEISNLAHEIFQNALGEMAPLKSQSGDPVAVFASTPDPRYRRQILRWLRKEHPILTENIKRALEAGLKDPDWEVRATALIMTGRYGAAELAGIVRSCELAPVNGIGPTRYDAGTFEMARRIVLHRLAGNPLPPEQSLPSIAEKAQLHLARCILEQPVIRRDHDFILINALTEPVLPAPQYPGPESLPAGIHSTPDGYSFQPLNMPLVWVGSVAHWLGDDRPDMAVANPIRQIAPRTGFLISATWFCPAERQRPFYVSFDEAQRLAEDLSARFGLRFRLPTPDEWEMAARGPDGRVFPWGNGIERQPNGLASAWGCGDLFRFGGEWTDQTTANGLVIVCGSSPRGCAARAAVSSQASKVGVRFVVEKL